MSTREAYIGMSLKGPKSCVKNSSGGLAIKRNKSDQARSDRRTAGGTRRCVEQSIEGVRQRAGRTVNQPPAWMGTLKGAG